MVGDTSVESSRRILELLPSDLLQSMEEFGVGGGQLVDRDNDRDFIGVSFSDLLSCAIIRKKANGEPAFCKLSFDDAELPDPISFSA
jgi:hypothetical protein